MSMKVINKIAGIVAMIGFLGICLFGAMLDNPDDFYVRMVCVCIVIYGGGVWIYNDSARRIKDDE